MAGWLYIILCAAFSVLIAHFFKIMESRNLSTIRVLTINYLFAFPMAFFLFEGHSRSHILSGELIFPLILAALTGVVFIVNFFIYSKSVYHNGMGISIAAMRISLIIPVLLSTFWYMEVLSVSRWTGIVLVFIVLFLLLPDKRSFLKEPFSVGWLLILLFVLTGFSDGSLKIFDVEFAHLLSKSEFMGLVFLIAFLVGIGIITFKKRWKFIPMEWLIGLCIGIPNLLAAISLLEALERMNGAIVFSAVNVLTVLGGTLIGVMFWEDRFTKLQWFGILLTVICILLLF